MQKLKKCVYARRCSLFDAKDHEICGRDPIAKKKCGVYSNKGVT